MPDELLQSLIARVPRPAAFEPDPQILGGGDPLFARAVRGLMASNPDLKRKIKSIQIGANDTVGDEFAAQRRSALQELGSSDRLGQFMFPQVDDYPYTNLLGIFSETGKNISLNPTLKMTDPYSPQPNKRGSMLQTLVHELAHAKGEPEIGADAAEMLLGPSHDEAISNLKANKPMRYYLRVLGAM